MKVGFHQANMRYTSRLHRSTSITPTTTNTKNMTTKSNEKHWVQILTPNVGAGLIPNISRSSMNHEELCGWKSIEKPWISHEKQKHELERSRLHCEPTKNGGAEPESLLAHFYSKSRRSTEKQSVLLPPSSSPYQAQRTERIKLCTQRMKI